MYLVTVCFTELPLSCGKLPSLAISLKRYVWTLCFFVGRGEGGGCLKLFKRTCFFSVGVGKPFGLEGNVR